MSLVCVAVILAISGMAQGAYAQDAPKLAPNTESIQISSASVVGVAGLGFILTRLAKHEHVKMDMCCLFGAHVAALIMAGWHLLVMLWAQKGTLLQWHYDVAIYASVILMVAMLGCLLLLSWSGASISVAKEIVKHAQSERAEDQSGHRGAPIQ